MKIVFQFLILVTQIAVVQGQTQTKENYNQLQSIPKDTNGVKLLLAASNKYSFFRTDTAMVLAQRALDLSKKLHYKNGEADALNTYGEVYHFMGDYPNALRMQFKALQMNREMKDKGRETGTLGLIGIVYNELGEYRQALKYLLPANKIFQEFPGNFEGSFELSNTGDAYDFLNMRDSALYYQRQAYEKFNDTTRPHLKSFILSHMGTIYFEIGNKDSALKFYNACILNSLRANDKINLSIVQNKIASLYLSNQQYDSSLFYARNAFQNAQSVPMKIAILQASNILADLFKKVHNPDSAFFYLDIASAMKDSLYGKEKFRQLQLLMLEEQEREQIINQQAEQFRNNIKYIALLSALGVFLLLAFILVRNNRRKQKANILLSEQKSQIEDTLTKLKSTQAQLIQSEKMASLGELTAGIAHEIQNPLNFVNNFSEVNTELIDELKQDLHSGNTNEALSVADDIKENNKKIVDHGKRADAIVKGMLQHSRVSSGQKEPTDINALCDEYLRLSYHGFRAKDKTFNATIKTDFDDTIGKINIIPQDIGRVFLNLFTNAFYAVNEAAPAKATADSSYHPMVTVSTKRIGDQVEVIVADNGNGIPQKILDKVFQPFFTTKPAGAGTGLGLSLSYDIIKAHGGKINVTTKENEGTVFLIQIPV